MTETPVPTEPESAVAALPGDVVQVTDAKHPWSGMICIIEQTRAWGVELYLCSPTGIEWRERAKADQVGVIGAAVLAPPGIAAARRDAVETARLLADEAKG